MPKQQHLNEVSVVHFAAARRRRAGWLPVRILRGANAATRAHVARVCACDKTRREEKEKLRRCCFCCRGRAASSPPFWRRRSAAPRRARWRRRGVGAAISRAPAASGAARPPCGAMSLHFALRFSINKSYLVRPRFRISANDRKGAACTQMESSDVGPQSQKLGASGRDHVARWTLKCHFGAKSWREMTRGLAGVWCGCAARQRCC